ncbi:MAG: hypothetical protein L6428_15990 [Candidatus Aminicenantes bacterium]|nr:hypothetical protein [Acidobacteriota bacterium]MCG2812935.1 hypothetical protein [Candidatus Aminicenantes bacterium]
MGRCRGGDVAADCRRSQPFRRSARPQAADAALGPDNGFFILWGFAEPPDSDPAGQAYRGLLLDLFAARAKDFRSRSPYGQWLARLNLGYREHWQVPVELYSASNLPSKEWM